MATASVTYQPAAGRAYIDLTSWAGNAAFTTTPVATDQVEGPDTLTLNADGTVTGADGTYTLRHIQAANGTTEAVSFQIGTPAQVPQGTITLGTATIGQTTIDLPFTYSDTDQTGFEYRVDGGTWTSTSSPVSLTGLTADTPYLIEVRAVNAEGGGTVASATETTDPVPSSATMTVAYQPESGRSFVTLTSWAGDASFSQTPVAGDQIEHPDALTVGVDGAITGADATYTIRHLRADGTTEAISYTIGAVAQVPQGAITIGTATIGETTASIPFTYDLSDQTGFEYRLGAEAWASTASPVALSGLTAETSYTVEIRAVNATGPGTTASTSITTLAAGTGPSSATTTVAYDAPTGKTAVTLATGFDDYIFQEWATQPVVGEQIVFTDSELTVDEFANVTTDTEDVFDIWFVELDGTVTATSVDSTGLASAVDTTPAQFTFIDQADVEPGSTDESNVITITDVEPGENVPASITGGSYAVSTDGGATFGGNTTANTNLQLNYKVKLTLEASSEFETAANAVFTAGGVSDTFTRTTRAAVLPTQDVVLPDLSLGETDAVSIDLDNYFSGASSYTLTGIPADSGLSFSGSVLSGNVNANDVSASPFTLTATAVSADGSIQDAFSVTVVDDIAPAISINALTTLDTTPIASGSAGDASAITLQVEGVDVTHSSNYTPTLSNGAWTQQLNELALGTYTMTATGVDDAGNESVVSATLKVVEQIATSPRGLFQPLFRSLTGSVNQTLFR